VDQLVCMRSFVRVADLYSFTRAADALGLSRAVVSTHVAELEKHLRCQLFHRTTRRVGLTADGTEYLARCQRILAELEAADEAVRGTRLSPQGRLRVDVPVMFGRALLLPALPKFTARYPQLQLEIQLNDRVVDMIAEGLAIGDKAQRQRLGCGGPHDQDCVEAGGHRVGQELGIAELLHPGEVVVYGVVHAVAARKTNVEGGDPEVIEKHRVVRARAKGVHLSDETTLAEFAAIAQGTVRGIVPERRRRFPGGPLVAPAEMTDPSEVT